MRKFVVAMAAALLSVSMFAGAAFAAPGKVIKEECGGASYGQLVSQIAKGELDHPGIAGNNPGAKAFAAIAAEHCNPPGE